MEKADKERRAMEDAAPKITPKKVAETPQTGKGMMIMVPHEYLPCLVFTHVYC